MKAIVKHLRLFPVVILVCAGLLAFKGFSLVDAARAAAEPPAAAAAEKPPADKAADVKPVDLALDDATDSSSEIDVLSSLGRRRKELDAQARELEMRANLLAAAEQRVDGKIADLKALQTQIQGLLGQRDEAQQKQIAALIKVYTAMKPKDAGRIFNTLDEDVLTDVATGMKPDVLAQIMSAMSSEKAQALTLKLANRLKLPKAAELAAPPQQLAAIVPPPGAPQPLPSSAAPPAVAPASAAPANAAAKQQASPPPPAGK